MTKNVRDTIAEVRDKVSRAGIDEARLNAELLVAYALGCERGELHARAAEALDAPTAQRLQAALDRRVSREPLEYILGWREFYSRRFACSPAALIPRPETEGIVDACKKALPRDFGGPGIDLGTGAGPIAITLALEFPRLKMWASDISLEALKFAAQNARTHKVERRVRFVCADWLAPCVRKPVWKLIVANPPYVDPGYSPIMQPEVRDFEPHVALFGRGEKGLGIIAALLPEVRARLAPDGIYVQEFGAGQGDDIEALARKSGFGRIEILQDFAGIERTLVARP